MIAVKRLTWAEHLANAEARGDEPAHCRGCHRDLTYREVGLAALCDRCHDDGTAQAVLEAELIAETKP